MKARTISLFIIIALSAGMLHSIAEPGPPVKGDMLPEVILPVPRNPQHRAYLGLDSETSFQVPQIKAPIVIIEIFSMYCPHCQREAPLINEFYYKIKNDENLKGKVKIIGIGVGNSDFEVNFFQDRYKIPFPLFADGDYSIHKMFGEVRTPYFIGVKITAPDKHQVFYSQLGGPEDSRKFLETMLQKSGLK